MNTLKVGLKLPKELIEPMTYQTGALSNAVSGIITL
jgi:hypothetical protein